MVEVKTKYYFYCHTCKQDVKPNKVVFDIDCIKHAGKCQGEIEMVTTRSEEIN